MIALGATPPVLLWALAHPPLVMYNLVTLRVRVHANLVGAYLHLALEPNHTASPRSDLKRAVQKAPPRPPAAALEVASTETSIEHATASISPPGTPSSSARVARRSLSWYRDDG